MCICCICPQNKLEYMIFNSCTQITREKNFIYCLADRSCKVLIAFPECPQSPVEVVSEGDKWPDGFSDKGGYSAAHRRCIQQVTGIRKIPMAAGLGPPQTWVVLLLSKV